MSLPKLGAIHHPPERRVLRLRKYLRDRGAVPAAPASWSVSPGGSYPIDGNDVYGDCVPCGIAHQIEAWQRRLGADRIYSASDVLAWYYSKTGGADTGMVPNSALYFWQQGGFPLSTSALPVDSLLGSVYLPPSDVPLLQTACQLFDGVMQELALPIAAQAGCLDPSLVWDVTTGPDSYPGNWGWHFALLSAYDADGVTFETWGIAKRATWAWWSTYAAGAWAGVGNDWQGDPAIDVVALEGDMAQLGGPLIAAPPTPAGLVFGVDVSYWQGPSINWGQAHTAGVRVAYVQATQGTLYQNPYFALQVAGARAAGIKVGAYHMSHPSQNSPQAEFSYFTAAVGSTKLDLPPMVDDETMGSLNWSQNVAWHQAFLSLCGAGALHYSDEYYLANMGPLGRQWTARPAATALGSGDFAVQFSLGSGLAGFPGNVDLDAFNPAILPTPPPPPPPPTDEETEMLNFTLAPDEIRFLPGPDQNTAWNAVAATDSTIRVFCYDLTGKVLGVSAVLPLLGNRPNVGGPTQQNGSTAALGATGPCTLGFEAGPASVSVSVHGL